MFRKTRQLSGPQSLPRHRLTVPEIMLLPHPLRTKYHSFHFHWTWDSTAVCHQNVFSFFSASLILSLSSVFRSLSLISPTWITCKRDCRTISGLFSFCREVSLCHRVRIQNPPTPKIIHYTCNKSVLLIGNPLASETIECNKVWNS